MSSKPTIKVRLARPDSRVFNYQSGKTMTYFEPEMDEKRGGIALERDEKGAAVRDENGQLIVKYTGKRAVFTVIKAPFYLRRIKEGSLEYAPEDGEDKKEPAKKSGDDKDKGPAKPDMTGKK